MFSHIQKAGFLMMQLICFSTSREGSLKVGDRILTINDFSVVALNLTEIYMLLSQCDNQTTFTVEYDISVIGKLYIPCTMIIIK